MRGELPLGLLASLLALCWITAGTGGSEEQTDEATARRALLQHDETPAEKMTGLEGREADWTLMDSPVAGVVDAIKYVPRARRSPQDDLTGEGHFC